MLSLICSPHFNVSQVPNSSMSSNCIFPIFLVITPPKREQHPLLRLKRKEKKRVNHILELSECCGVVSMCKKRWEGDGDAALELQVLDFMKNSKNPEVFPSKKQLVEAGRGDLVDAIVSRGGWMSMGWENDDDDYDKEVKLENGLVQSFDFGIKKCGNVEIDGNLQGESLLGDSSSAVSPSGRSIEVETEQVSGIEGILHGLERQRNLSFGINMRKNGRANHGAGSSNQYEQGDRTSKDVDSCHPEGRDPASLGRYGPISSENGSIRSYSDELSSSLKTDTWRSWSVQRAGYPDTDFEAAEIDFGGTLNERTTDDSMGETIGIPMIKDLETLVRQISQTDVKNRLQHLQLELSSTLHAISSSTTDLSGKAEEHSFEDLRQLSDASEFQENEIMQTQGKLRSMRAKLAVLEGKMALAIIDAQKILEEKQKRIDGARLALQLLRTTSIVWPNSGSEVLLAGSFDGWATQRRMERSSSGIFSLRLKLYPGQYQIKFIVDGAWMVDPLRPIVNHDGFDNNLLIIS